MMVLNLGASTTYLFSGDYRRCVYWFAAFVLNASITF